MTIDEILRAIENKKPSAPADTQSEFEASLGVSLPGDYRHFLILCNGGYVGGSLWYNGLTPAGVAADAGVQHVGGFREEPHLSLTYARRAYAGRIPDSLLWIMDDPFGNAICLGIRGAHQGRIYFWDHEAEPDPERWDGEISSAGNVTLIANSFTEFLAGLNPL